MNIFEEDLKDLENLKRGKKPKKKISPTTWIIISIVFLVIILFVILGLIIYLQKSILNIEIDGVSENDIAEIIVFDEEDKDEIYFPIRRMAAYFGYDSYNGDYPEKSEDSTKCYVSGNGEVTVFSLDSNIIRKVINSNNSSYEEKYELDQKVKQINEELYTTRQGIEMAFNSRISYNKEANNISINTIQYLAKQYNTFVIKNYGYAGIKLDDVNVSMIFDDMAIVQNYYKTAYGVIQLSTGKILLEAKYDDINYLKNTQDFLIKTNGKYGVISKNSRTIIQPEYDYIGILSDKYGYYVVRKNEKYGILNTSGEQILYPEYDGVGVNNINKFKYIGNCTSYVLLDNLIPIWKEDELTFYNIKDKKLMTTNYLGVGCETNVATQNNALIIPDVDLLVVLGDNKYYTMIDENGKDVFDGQISLNSIYSITNSSGTIYYMTSLSGQTFNVLDTLKRQFNIMPK